MVAATPAASRNHPPKPKNPSPLPRRADPENRHRQPLIPSDNDNAASAVPRRSQSKEISSRYLSSYAIPTFSSPSPSKFCPAATTFSSSSSSSSSGFRRFPSPLASPRPSTPPALSRSSAQKRSHSVGRVRPLTPRPDLCPVMDEPSANVRALCTTTRSLSVSFQGGSFFYQSSREKTTTASPVQEPSPEHRRAGGAAEAAARTGDHLENSKPLENHCPWPASSTQSPNPFMRRFDCSSEQKDPILTTVRLLQQSVVFNDATRRGSFDGTDLSASLEADRAPPGSNSGVPESSLPPRTEVTSRGISVPARYLQESSSRICLLRDSGPLLSPGTRPMIPPKPGLMKKLSVDSPSLSLRSVSSPLHGPIRQSLTKHLASPSRGIASPLASSRTTVVASPGVPANAPSILSFATEVRRAKKGENRIEEAHMLRLVDNRRLQWRFVNARTCAVLQLQKVAVEKNMFDASDATSKLRDSVVSKRIQLQHLKQNLKLASILEEQMTYLDEWSPLDRDHSNSLSGVVEALKATTVRLPVVSGAKANIEEVKYAVGTAVEVMQTLGSSTSTLLSKVEEASSMIVEIAKVAAEERSLLDESRDLLFKVETMHVMQCSLQSHIIQLKEKASQMQL